MLNTTVLSNSAGMQVTLANYGARILSIRLPIDGKLTEMLASYSQEQDFIGDPSYLGATCGPVCNRIKEGCFFIDGETYQLNINDGVNALHGGDNNISFQYWQVTEQSDNLVEYQLLLSHLEDGFPGNRVLKVKYQLDDDNQLHMSYEASTSATTILNLTNHAYFNLGEQDILHLSMKLQSSTFLERHGDGLPTGNFIPVSGMGYNSRDWQVMDDLVNHNKYPQMAQEQGIDHCFVLDNHAFSTAKAELYSKQNKVKLQVFSNQPAMQIYTGKFLSGELKPYQGMCFECQGYTDAINHPSFPNITLSPEQEYKNKTVYRFDLEASS